MASLPPSPSLAPFGFGQDPLTIGGVTLQAEEGPDTLAIGAEQKTKIIELVGGGRVILTLGTQPEDISFTGMIWGRNVPGRVAALRQLRDAGAETSLRWKTESYRGVLTKFTPKFGAIDAVFDLTFAVSRATNGTLAVAKANAVDSQVATMMSNAQILQAAIVAADVSSAAQALAIQLANVQIALAEVGSLASLGGPALTGFLNIVQTGVAAYSAYTASLANDAPAYGPAAQITTLLSLVARNAEQGQSANAVQVQGGSYLELASTMYGDPDLAFTLADINGATAARLPGNALSTVTLPPLAGVGSS